MNLKTLLVLFGVTVVFSKELLLLNDSFVIIIVFAVVFMYIVSLSSTFIVDHINSVRSTLYNDYSVNIKEEELVRNFYIKEITLILSLFYSIELYIEYFCDLWLERLSIN